MTCLTCGRPVDRPELKGAYCSLLCAAAAPAAGIDDAAVDVAVREALTVAAAEAGPMPHDLLASLTDEDDRGQ